MVIEFDRPGFSKTFSRLLDKHGVSCYAISQYSDLDQAYLSRLRSGKKECPSIEVILKIAFAVSNLSEKIVSLNEIEDLFNSANRTFFHLNR